MTLLLSYIHVSPREYLGPRKIRGLGDSLGVLLFTVDFTLALISVPD